MLARLCRRWCAPALAVVALLLVVGCAEDRPDGAPAGGDRRATATDPPAAATDPAPPEPDVPPLHPDVDGWDATVVTLHGADGTARVDARVAATSEQLRRGLMHVPELPAGAGMLFLFDGERTGAFWMKDTLVPLDIAFAVTDGTIAAILTMTPCPADPCPTYDPEAVYATALEVPAGFLADAGIEVGDRLAWSDPQPGDG